MGEMGSKTPRRVIIVLIVIMLVSMIAVLFWFQSNAVKIKPDMENNRNSNVSTVNNSHNTTNATKNIISIKLEKPPFIKD
jgi:flagellar basal body-associated protein FliL